MFGLFEELSMSDTKTEFAQGALFYPLLSIKRFEARTLFGCLLISSLAAHQGAAISEHTCIHLMFRFLDALMDIYE